MNSIVNLDNEAVVIKELVNLTAKFITDGSSVNNDLLKDFIEKYDRPYHNLNHIAYVLNRLNFLGNKSDVVKYAALFHDVIYKPGDPENENKSAEYALDFLEAHGIGDSILLGEIHGLIRSTRGEPRTYKESILHDADYAILAEVWDNVLKYEEALRQEFSRFSDKEYVDGRTQFLMNLQEKGNIFHSFPGIYSLETAARANIPKLINHLRENSNASNN